MTVNMSILARKGSCGLAEKLFPLDEIEGVRDYFFTDRTGTILARKPGSFLGEEVAAACARDMAHAGEILSVLPGYEGDRTVFDFHFKGVSLIGWFLGDAYLMVVCRETVSPAMLRMTVNIIIEEMRKQKRLRGYLQRSEREYLPGEEEVGTERYKHVLALKPNLMKSPC